MTIRSFVEKNACSIKKVGEIVSACAVVLSAVAFLVKPWAVQEISKDFVPRGEYQTCKDETAKTMDKVVTKLEKMGNDISYIKGRMREDFVSSESESNTRTAWKQYRR